MLWSEINIFQSVILSCFLQCYLPQRHPLFFTYLVPLFQVGLPFMMWSVPMQLLSTMISPMGCIGLKYPAVRLVCSTHRPFQWQRLQKPLQRAVLSLRFANLSVLLNSNHCERAQWVVGIKAGWNKLKAQRDRWNAHCCLMWDLTEQM